MNKDQRRTLIAQLVTENELQTQEELLQLLKQEGVTATQATISRDIRELHIVKNHLDNGKTIYQMYQKKENSPVQSNHLQETIQENVLKIDRVEFMTILHTTTGAADFVAAVIDEMQLAEIVATMAGTDTLLIISKSVEEAKVLAEQIEEIHSL
ncbi:arginine repressor [Enterococcus timonensis]|uniref:arginine repressor n=1 Tax=Enterococcus timonensis TaxID=1852364 RepID=UPI0008DAF00C|nr:arginine repressor [Enterococcus timonensis]